MAHSKPVITPEAFTGTASESWTEWIDHFESVADINKWESNADRLKWLKVRLTGRAIKAFRQLPEAARRDYKEAKKALKKRFEPESRKTLYIAELQTRRRRKGEDWATFGEELKLIAEKAYPDLEANAREQIALNQYLTSLTNPQVSFSVRQQRPTTIDRAVTVTMEMESYLGPKTTAVAQVGATGGCEIEESDDLGIAAVTKDATLELLQRLTDRLDKLESKFDGGAENSKPKRARTSKVTCWNCRRDGHIAKNCTEPKRSPRSGGERSETKTSVSTVGIDSQTTITAVQSRSKSDCHVQGGVNGISTNFLVDTGADVSLLSMELWTQIEATAQTKSKLEPSATAQGLVGVQGSPLQIHGVASVEIELAKEKFSSRVIVVDSLTSEAILGKDFLKDNRCVVNVGRNTLHFETHGITLPLNSPPVSQQVARVIVSISETLEVPPRSEMEVMAKVPGVAAEGTWMVEQEERSNAVLVARAVVAPEQLFALLFDYADIFAADQDDLGRTGKIKHKINTGDSSPIRQPVRRVPPIRRDEARTLLQGMLQKGVIKPSTSPWASPIVLVKKKDGSTRFCVDYRKVNHVTRKDAYPLPRVDDILDTLAGSQYFSTLDLLSGYWQVEVDQEDQDKTAFCTPDGLFEFQVMPFGLCNAPATFQRLMELVLAGLQWTTCLVYLDDVIVVGRNFEEHLLHLKSVFQRMRESNLKLKPTKCALCLEKVNFLGHVVSRDGVATDPAKTNKVAQWPTPSTKKEVQRFLGLASYYRRFVENFATIAKPLHQLIEKNREFKWTEQCQHAFEELRHRLVSAPVLSFPDFTKPFVLDTDASDTGIGAVLSQLQEDGSERVIAYASRVLSKPERRYCVTRKELLAVVVFVKQFRPYLLGKRFTLRTDHGSLTWLWNFRNPEGQLARWLERLQEFNFEIVHRQGRKHGNADAMSRMPCVQCGRDDHDDDNTVAVVSQVASLEQKTSKELRTSQLEDPTVGYILKAREADQKPSTEELKGKSMAVKRLSQLWEKLEVTDGILWRNFEDDTGNVSWKQLIVPESLRSEVLQELHAGVFGGHLGLEKTTERLKKRFYWLGYAQDIRNWCQTCATCAARKTMAPKNRAPLQTIEVGYPMQVVAVDIVGPFPESEAGNSYILVVGDYFSKWMEAYPIPNQEASTVARKLVDEFFCRFSTPEQLHSDQGKQFESELLKEICSILNIVKTRTTAYHPQCDGLVERFNRTLLSMLATTVADHPFGWEEALPKMCMAYNSSVHSTTGYTPFFLMYGREARLPIDIVYGVPAQQQQDETTCSTYASSMRKTLERAYERVRIKLSTGHKVQKQLYDKRVHGNEYQEGELVWLHSTVIPKGRSKKLHLPWTGPYRILKTSECDYRIKLPDSRKPPMVVHFNRLKLCPPSTRLSKPIRSKTVTDSIPPPPLGTELEIVDDDNENDTPDDETQERRYPSRSRQPPNRYSTVITHS